MTNDQMGRTNWYVITGGPSAGKTTTVNLRSKRGYKTTIEHPRHYLDTQRADGKTVKEVRVHQTEFQLGVLNMQIGQEASLFTVLADTKSSLLKMGEVMNTAPSIAPQTEEAIKNIVEKHRVCYEWSNDYEMVNGVRSPTGYFLRLYGTNIEHDAGIDSGMHPVPGCAACRKTYFDLLGVAKWIMPKEKRETQYKIEPFDNAFHFAPKRNWREEIVVAIQVLHRDGVSRPQNECEILCLKEMCAKLKKVGVLEGRVNREFGGHN